MSNAAINPAAPLAPDNHPPADHGARVHDPHLAHHFDTPEQQYSSAKLGMWVFLGTEILMFGGLFCAYSVYRHNHPDVFAFAHQFLNRPLGAINTLVLITSSLTMAWAVRSSQLGNQTSLRWLMAVTILGGYVFLGIKSIEYHTKWEHILFIGEHNQFRSGYTGAKEIEEEERTSQAKPIAGAAVDTTRKVEPAKAKEGAGAVAEAAPERGTKLEDPIALLPADPNFGTADAAKIRPSFLSEIGRATEAIAPLRDEVELRDLTGLDKERLYTFFAIYFFMTGLHGLHVVIGMSLIAWVLLRAVGPRNIGWAVPMIPGSIGVFISVVGIIVGSNHLIIAGLVIAVLSVIWALIWTPMRRNRSGEGEFGPTYFTPVDLTGLYWHLVDLIWIFLFPLLYLIH